MVPKGSDKSYCNTHIYYAKTEEKIAQGEEWVVCPFEPGLKLPAAKLEAHIKVCPKNLQLKDVANKPYFKLNVNILDRSLNDVKPDPTAEFSVEKIH